MKTKLYLLLTMALSAALLLSACTAPAAAPGGSEDAAGGEQIELALHDPQPCTVDSGQRGDHR